MRALAASGNAAQAVNVFSACRRVLQEQIGVSPSGETERLYRELRGQDKSIGSSKR